MATDGITSAGAKLKIWVIYIRDINDVRPVENTPFISMPHRELTLPALWASSPEEYLRKNLAGRDSTLIMTAASTETEVLT